MNKYVPEYEVLSEDLAKRMEREEADGSYQSYAFREGGAVRRDNDKDKGTLLRPAFARDIDKILHCPYYNRYADKTQVFSFYKNDDITRRALHVQLVSRIARNIGRALHLNCELIEAIALGHDLGHTPFGHAGERILDEILFEHTGRHFCHNLHSVRVLDGLFPYNVTLQTLDGIACHDGELELEEYAPRNECSFEQFDEMIEGCYLDKSKIRTLIPATLEGCVVRIADIIAYLGKDRQDALRAGIARDDSFEDRAIGKLNAEIINNLTVNIVENSYGKPYIKMDKRHFEALKGAKEENYRRIYRHPAVTIGFDERIRPMMRELFDRLLEDLQRKDRTSPIYTHHIAYVNGAFYLRKKPYEQTGAAQIVADYIASMTDDYFVDLYRYLFPESPRTIGYIGYFEGN